MPKTAQQRALENFRSRLAERGLVRFEVIGRDSDRELMRSLARRLAEGGQESERLRAAVHQQLGAAYPKKGGILKALLESPLIGAHLQTERPADDGRKADI